MTISGDYHKISHEIDSFVFSYVAKHQVYCLQEAATSLHYLIKNLDVLLSSVHTIYITINFK